MKHRFAYVALPLALAAAGCDDPTSPETVLGSEAASLQNGDGSGLVLESLTGLNLPLIGSLGTITIDEAVLTNFELIENAVGAIVGVEVEGVLSGVAVDVLGTHVVTEEFLTTVSVTSSGPGQCDLVSLNLGPINLDVLGIAGVDVPVATLTGRGSGALGSLLCNLGNLLSGLLGGGVGNPGAQDVVDAINGQI